jgi:hypothetical protein
MRGAVYYWKTGKNPEASPYTSFPCLMNISRSADPQDSNFKWERFEGVNK